MTAVARLYVAGPMSGYPDFNYPAFNAAAERLRAANDLVENPAENPEEIDWQGYMRTALAQVVRVEGVAVLPDWQMSRGATLEVHVAHALQLPVLTVDHWLAKAVRS